MLIQDGHANALKTSQDGPKRIPIRSSPSARVVCMASRLLLRSTDVPGKQRYKPRVSVRSSAINEAVLASGIGSDDAGTAAAP